VATTLSLLQRNRALLARQWLLGRQRATPARAIEHLVGLQAQNTQPPYVGLWSRVAGFQRDALGKLLLTRRAVRLALMRSTIHLVTARDCLALRPVLQPALTRGFHVGSPFSRRLGALDYGELVDAARRLFEEKPRTTSEVGRLLGERWPRRDAEAMANAARAFLPLVQLPPRGVWGDGALPVCALADDWLGKPVTGPTDPAPLVLRYLRAFGPASLRDAQSWSGLPELDEPFERLRPKLRVFRDERGRELFDVPRGPLPDEATPALPRLLGEYDNVLLGHADRSHVMTEPARKQLFVPGNVRPALMIDGFVAGAWTLEVGRSAVVRVDAFDGVPRAARSALRDEALAFARFAAPEAPRHEVSM
jgi:hypothetical protein